MSRKLTKIPNKPVKTNEIEIAIAELFGIRKHIIVPNLSWGFGMHECDMFIIKTTGIAVEVEIKISKSDLLADFKKGHGHIDKKNRITEFYYAMPEELYKTCIDLIPENAGIILCYRWIDYKKQNRVSAKFEKKPKRIKGARKLTIDEQLKVAKLGTMRIWSLKRKIIKNTKP